MFYQVVTYVNIMFVRRKARHISKFIKVLFCECSRKTGRLSRSSYFPKALVLS